MLTASGANTEDKALTANVVVTGSIFDSFKY